MPKMILETEIVGPRVKAAANQRWGVIDGVSQSGEHKVVSLYSEKKINTHWYMFDRNNSRIGKSVLPCC